MHQRNKRQRVEVDLPRDQQPQQPQMNSALMHDDQFINDHEAVDSGGDDDDDDDGKKSEKKAGRRKIKIEFIQDKSRRHITFSKRKAGIMKKAYELSTLTGTQVLLLVVSETGLVYTFTTAKLQPLVTQPEGKNLIQACLNAPQGTLPSAMPVGSTIGRSGGPPPPMGSSAGPPAPGSGSSNLPGGLSIGNNAAASAAGQSVDDDEDEEETARPGDKRRRRASSTASNSGGTSGANQRSPNSAHASISSALPPSQTQSQQQQPPQQQTASSIALSPTSPQSAHANPPGQGQYSGSGSYAHEGMYGAAQGHGHMMAGYPAYNSNPQGSGSQQPQLGGLSSASAQHGHWAQPPPGAQYVRR
jgi:pheromone receptor transcription factor